MDSSDDDFLPDPERYKGRDRTEPPDKGGMGDDDPANKQRGLTLHDDFTKGKCFFIFLK